MDSWTQINADERGFVSFICENLRLSASGSLFAALKEYEDTRRLSSDPVARRRAAAEIEKLRADLDCYQVEYRELGCT